MVQNPTTLDTVAVRVLVAISVVHVVAVRPLNSLNPIVAVP